MNNLLEKPRGYKSTCSSECIMIDKKLDDPLQKQKKLLKITIEPQNNIKVIECEINSILEKSQKNRGYKNTCSSECININ